MVSSADGYPSTSAGQSCYHKLPRSSDNAFLIRISLALPLAGEADLSELEILRTKSAIFYGVWTDSSSFVCELSTSSIKEANGSKIRHKLRVTTAHVKTLNH